MTESLFISAIETFLEAREIRLTWRLERAAGIFDLHIFDVRQYPGDVVVVDGFEKKIDVLVVHDAGRTICVQFDIIAVLLPGGNRASGDLSPDPVSLEDET